MTYLELMNMRKKYCDNAATACLGIFSFYFIATAILSFAIPPIPSFIFLELVVVGLIFILTSIALLFLCALRIYLYLGDEMKKAKME